MPDTVDATNPLLRLAPPLPFDRIRAEHIVPAIRELLDDARRRIQRIIDTPGPRSYANTLGEYDEATVGLGEAMALASHLEGVATSAALREAYNTVQPEVSEFYSNLPLNAGLWAAFKAFAETDEAHALTGTRRRYLEKVLAEFRREGADLDPEGKKRLSEIDVELARLTLRYSQNVLDGTNAFALVIDDEARLAGLPRSAVEAARASAEAAGVAGYRFTLQAPSYIPVLTYLDDRALREQMYRAYNTRATQAALDNRPLIAQIVELRRRRAALLGYKTFADLVLEDRMAHTGDEARRFVHDLRDRTLPFFARENTELQAFRREIEGADAPPLAAWDVSYYAEKQRRARFDFDEEALRPYFPAGSTLAGMFEVAHRLYGVRIEPWHGAPVWDTNVTAWLIRDGAPAGSHGADARPPIAGFYVDLYPRENKRDGAWMSGLITGAGEPREGEPAPRQVGILAANLTPPVGDRPALLNHRDVETLFHEFGHLLHHALTRVEVRALAGTNVAWDFVELPSQIMENWCWEREALDVFARHFATGETIPEPLLERMRAARTFRAANAMMRQLGFAEVDLALHIDFDPARDGDVVAYARGVQQQFAPAPLPDEYAMIAAFTHLFASPVGYAAGYYSYKWAEVLDADAFSRFLREGLFSREVGGAFRAEVLARGDSDDPMNLYKRFMGREPRLDALLVRSGLLREADAGPAAAAP